MTKSHLSKLQKNRTKTEHNHKRNINTTPLVIPHRVVNANECLAGSELGNFATKRNNQ